MFKRFILFTLILLAFSLNAQNDESQFEAKIDSILQIMTLDEKLGQMNLPASGDITTGQAKSSDIANKIREGKVGGLFNLKSVEKIKEIQRIAVEESRLGIPLLIGMDVIHGYETTFPIPLGLTASWDMDLIEQSARIAATEAAADGINWTFSPMTDVSREPRWGRISEGSGEDPMLGGEVAAAMVRGYQGNDLSNDDTILACVKHFALYGASEAGRDYNTVDMSRIRMFNEYLEPYKDAVDAGVASVMAAFNEVDGIPAHGNKWLLTDLLREKWGFDGFIVSDYTGINEMIAHGMGDLQTVSALAVNAGIDMDMVGEGILTTIKKSLDQGKIQMKDIDDSVKRILRAKYQLGLIDDPYKYTDVAQSQRVVFNNEHRAIARKSAAESMVLLKNDETLPLKKQGTIALVGPLSNNRVNMAGTWSVATVQENSISVLEGLKEVAGPNVKIVQAIGSNLDYDQELQKNSTLFGKDIKWDDRGPNAIRDEAMKAVAQADVIIAAVGESAEMSGESASRTNLKIPQAQKDLLDALYKTGKPVVLVVFTGRPLALVEEDKRANSILNVWFPGSMAGLSISDVLFSAVNPSGKLPVTFPRNVGQVPIYYNHKMTGRPISNTEGKFEKYRSNYLDVQNEPLYPFGYGLSYTTFEYTDLKLSSPVMSANGEIELSVNVSNTGDYDGAEVVQLYTRDLVGSVTRPVKELKDFQKVFLNKGETKTITFTITEEDLKFYNSNLDFVAEAGEFEVFVGGNSRDTLKGSFELKK